MINNQKNKTIMPTQESALRNKNFKEVALGYNYEQALNEAKRCLNCKHKPCVGGCPVSVQIPDFIQQICQGNLIKAYEIIKNSSSLPAVCSRVCPQENQCELKCIRKIKDEPVGIGNLERFVADYYNTNIISKKISFSPNGYKVAIIGSGPAGLSCASDLAKLGYDVTIYEALHLAGGVLVYGIPEFRLPKEIVHKEIESLKNMGVKILTNMVIGKILSIDELINTYNYDAVFVGTGAGLPKFLNIPGENLNGVYSANEFLTRINLMKAYSSSSETPIMYGKNIAIVGGGNVAMDAARCAKRLGAENVYIIYRRSMDELPARKEEISHAQEEGIIFKLLCNPIEIFGDENCFVKQVKCIEMELGEPDQSGRRKPIIKKNSEFIIDIDCIIISIGTSPNPLIKDTTKGLDTHIWGGIIIDEKTGQTSKEKVFAGGDAVTGAATVIQAMGAGKNAAQAIDNYIKSKVR